MTHKKHMKVKRKYLKRKTEKYFTNTGKRDGQLFVRQYMNSVPNQVFFAVEHVPAAQRHIYSAAGTATQNIYM